MDRMVKRTDALSASDTYQYDYNGNRTGHTDRNGNGDAFSYDALNRKTCTAYGAGGGTASCGTLTGYADTIADTYDAGDRTVSAADSTAGATLRTYDGLDDLSDEQSPQGEVAYTYDLAGRRQTMQIVNPSSQSQPQVGYTWDNANRVLGVAQGSAAGLYYTPARCYAPWKIRPAPDNCGSG